MTEFKSFIELCQRCSRAIPAENFEFKFISKSRGGEHIEIIPQEETTYLDILYKKPETNYLFKFHYLYSDTFMVPVVYFRIFDEEKNIDLDPNTFVSNIEVKKLISGSTNLTIITPDAHPIYGDLYFTFHSCQMEAFLKNLNEIKENEKVENKINLFLLMLTLYLSEFEIYFPSEFVKSVIS